MRAAGGAWQALALLVCAAFREQRGFLFFCFFFFLLPLASWKTRNSCGGRAASASVGLCILSVSGSPLGARGQGMPTEQRVSRRVLVFLL